MSRFTLAAVILAGAVPLAACNNSINNPSIPTTPSLPSLVTDTFQGTVGRNGATTYPFSVSSAGAVAATVQTLSDASKSIGVYLGTWNGTSCAVVIANDQATEGTTVTGAATSFGTLCVRVYDAGQVEDPLDYSLRVIHP